MNNFFWCDEFLKRDILIVVVVVVTIILGYFLSYLGYIYIYIFNTFWLPGGCLSPRACWAYLRTGPELLYVASIHELMKDS